MNNINNSFYQFAKATSKATPSQIGDYMHKFNQRPMNYVTPYIIEQSNMNMTQLDVFSRLMLDRVLFLGDEIDDTVSNISTYHTTVVIKVVDKDLESICRCTCHNICSSTSRSRCLVPLDVVV